MYRQDYIIRLIQQLSRALAGLLARILDRGSPATEIHAEILAIAKQSGLDLDVARRLDASMLLMWLAPRGEIDPGRFWLMGELLFLEGMQARQEGSSAQARADFERAHVVFSRLEPDWRPEAGLASAGERVIEIRRLLDERAP